MRRIGKHWKRLVAAALILLLVLLAATGVAMQHKPAWFRPAILTEDDLQRLRREAISFVDDIGDQLVRGRPFVLEIRERRINEWLGAIVAASADDPDWPIRITSPVTHVGDQRIQLGAIFERNGWRSVLHLGCTVRLVDAGRSLHVALEGVYCGAVPLPRRIIRDVLTPHLIHLWRDGDATDANCIRILDREVCGVDELFAGISFPNRFVWPNGKRAFRIDGIEFEAGGVRVKIQPL